jgi:hypothetical protein
MDQPAAYQRTAGSGVEEAMNLNPKDAQKLAGVLLDSEGDDEAAEPERGRLAPGAFGRYRITGLVGVGGMGEV